MCGTVCLLHYKHVREYSSWNKILCQRPCRRRRHHRHQTVIVVVVIVVDGNGVDISTKPNTSTQHAMPLFKPIYGNHTYNIHIVIDTHVHRTRTQINCRALTLALQMFSSTNTLIWSYLSDVIEHTHRHNTHAHCAHTQSLNATKRGLMCKNYFSQRHTHTPLYDARRLRVHRKHNTPDCHSLSDHIHIVLLCTEYIIRIKYTVRAVHKL